MNNIHTYLWLEDHFVDFVHNPDELSTINALHEGVTDVLGTGCTERTDDALSPRHCALGTEGPLQSIRIHTEKLGSKFGSFAVVNE